METLPIKKNISFELQPDVLIVRFDQLDVGQFAHSGKIHYRNEVRSLTYTKSPYGNCQIQTIGHFNILVLFLKQSDKDHINKLLNGYFQCRDLVDKVDPVSLEWLHNLCDILAAVKPNIQIDVSSNYEVCIDKFFGDCLVSNFKIAYQNTTGNRMIQYLINLQKVLEKYKLKQPK